MTCDAEYRTGSARDVFDFIQTTSYAKKYEAIFHQASYDTGLLEMLFENRPYDQYIGEDGKCYPMERT